jgi:two-component system phosphate regulon sensor histidine kinase PhoR
VQGVFIDPYWLFAELPVWVSDRVLSGSERFQEEDPLLPAAAASTSEYRFPVSLVRTLGFESATPDTGIGEVNVVIDEGEIESRYQAQSWRFFGVAAMLALTLGTGMALLLRSVNRELEQAQQTENFVAAVTHELRTPLSAIRLHGEMLLEGWVSDETKRNEYYSRIVRETGRLSTLVERVLEKARLSSNAVKPVPGDLSAVVARLRPELEQRAGGDGSDLDFELDDHLPAVMLHPEAVSGILDNLVENARKYARGTNGEAPARILVRTRRERGSVVLEVADRGPGIPDQEAERIFEAFYRVGNEATRTSTGTGLGLHLVAVHAESMGGRASVEPRPGGGALFRIGFRRA